MNRTAGAYGVNLKELIKNAEYFPYKAHKACFVAITRAVLGRVRGYRLFKFIITALIIAFIIAVFILMTFGGNNISVVISALTEYRKNPVFSTGGIYHYSRCKAVSVVFRNFGNRRTDSFLIKVYPCSRITNSYIFNINKHGISSATINRIRKGEGITTQKINDFCKILHCNVEDIIKYIEEEPDI